MAISGVMKQKIAKGKYVIVATPSTLDWTTAQVFQGISTELTVPLSSSVRLRTSGARPKVCKRHGTYCPAGGWP